MKFGAQVNTFGPPWADIRVSIQSMEAGRWNSLWAADHFLSPFGRTQEHMNAFESFTVLSVAAGMTERLELGTLVMGNTYRNPGLVAKIATSLDQASKGRFILGLGAAWFKREHEAYGWEFPPVKERSDRLEEAAGLIRTLFTADRPVDHRGKYYRLDQAPLAPTSYRQPHLPIMIGGNGERRTLRTLAMYGDVFNFNGWEAEMSPETVQHKLSVLARHCDDIGRDPAEIRNTLHMPLTLTDEGSSESPATLGPGLTKAPVSLVVDRVGALERVGIAEIIFQPQPDVAALQRLDEEVLAAFG